MKPSPRRAGAGFLRHSPSRLSAPRRYEVLLVEDNPSDADLARARLSDSSSPPIGIHHVTTAAEAVAVLSTFDFDTVVLDLGLPDCEGIETLRRICPVAGDTPVIVLLTGLMTSDLMRQAIEEGAHEVLNKNETDTHLFARTVAYIIEHARATEEHRLLEKVLETVPDGVVMVSSAGTVTYVNTFAQALFGHDRHDLVGNAFDFAIKAGESREIEIRGDSGGKRTCVMRTVPMEWRREAASLVSIRDITEQKEMESRLEISDRMASLGSLAAGIAHEINNPLTAIRANLDLAAREISRLADRTTVSRDLVEEVDDAREAAERIRVVVRDLGVFSRSEDAMVTSVDVHRVIESALRMAWNELRHRARVVTHFGSVPPVLVNESKLGQVLLNLIVNAAQSMSDGHTEDHEVAITTRCDDSGQVVISIADTGCGIPEAVGARIFMPFDASTPAQPGAGAGTGLGLAICHRIIASMKGSISFASRIGPGSCFVVTLPSAASAVVDTSARALSRGGPDPSGRRSRVLVVDDEATILGVIVRILETEHEVVAMDDAEKALEALAGDEAFDVILCDLMMPEMTGAEFHAGAKRLNRAAERRIVFMTGGAFTPESHAFLNSVSNPRIGKPFDVLGLKQFVNALVREWADDRGPNRLLTLDELLDCGESLVAR